MPIPTKWKLVAGSVTAVVGISATASAGPRDQASDIELEDLVAVTEVSDVRVDLADVDGIATLSDVGDSFASPFDTADEAAQATAETNDDGVTGGEETAVETAQVDADESPATADSPATPDSPASPDSPDSPDSPASPDSPDSPDSPASPDSPDSPDTADSP